MMSYNIFVDLSSNRLEPNMEDIPVPSENTFDVTLPAAHSVSIFFYDVLNVIFSVLSLQKLSKILGKKFFF
jgi:hypothetical protein